jgi:hypothetical protein
MKRKWMKNILLYTGVTFLLMVMVLGVHIYMVTRPKAPDANIRVMARIDIKQAITQQDADAITAWMYQQKGVDRVLCNPESDILVFTYFPVKTDANLILRQFKSSFNMKAERYMPTAAELQTGCPVAAGPATTRIYNSIKHIFN